MKLVYVEWIDHWSIPKVFNTSIEEDLKDTCLCRTVGWIIREDKDQVSIASTQDPWDYKHVINIYKPCIKKRRVLKVP